MIRYDKTVCRGFIRVLTIKKIYFCSELSSSTLFAGSIHHFELLIFLKKIFVCMLDTSLRMDKNCFSSTFAKKCLFSRHSK